MPVLPWFPHVDGSSHYNIYLWFVLDSLIICLSPTEWHSPFQMLSHVPVTVCYGEEVVCLRDKIIVTTIV